MFNPTAVVASAFGDYLEKLYTEYFSGRKPEYAAYIGGAARLVLERLGNTDALYHNAEHTMMVTLVGQQIMRGRLVSEAVQPEDWLHYTLSLLVHDIGFARGICKGDTDSLVVINASGETICPPRGASDGIPSRLRHLTASFIARTTRCSGFNPPARRTPAGPVRQPALRRRRSPDR